MREPPRHLYCQLTPRELAEIRLYKLTYRESYADLIRRLILPEVRRALSEGAILDVMAPSPVTTTDDVLAGLAVVPDPEPGPEEDDQDDQDDEALDEEVESLIDAAYTHR